MKKQIIKIHQGAWKLSLLKIPCMNNGDTSIVLMFQ